MADPLINLGELSKPATVLIEKVSDAVGGIAKPWQIKRVAAAEVEAEKIRALAQIEITDIQQRALVRMIKEEGVRQENIEAITAGALPYLKDDADPRSIEVDWLSNFFEKSRIVSDEQVQNLWSRILAEEANSPSRFSKRSIDVISNLSKADAALFTIFCSSVWRFHHLEAVFIYNQEMNSQMKSSYSHVSFSDLLHLESIGLVKFDPTDGFLFLTNHHSISASYYGVPIMIKLADNGNSAKTLQRGNVSLTATGRELASICGSSPNRGQFDEALQTWIEGGHHISTSLDSRDHWLALIEDTDRASSETVV